eukprot:CAMPEP_0202036448 /NCGR_PEP_ID=MMETSP0962-20130828/1556_1 /ASSEMBLY_ACC=CAM_ASM_000488 /TAXON_ID=4773 /ORGANISM="Schizochytrium aggregatum, Strain ATCC28209" /LENGTH=199 /DNA_ID=CAMNT_0048600523 /DNA_START=60 /DNA_END=654 /DNA_ORIENTATION=-
MADGLGLPRVCSDSQRGAAGTWAVEALGVNAAVAGEDLARHVGAGRQAQEGDARSLLVRFGQPAEGRPSGGIVRAVGVLLQGLLQQRGEGHPRAQAVHAHSEARPLACECAGELHDGSFRERVDCARAAAADAGDARDVDDAAPRGLERGREGPRESKGAAHVELQHGLELGVRGLFDRLAHVGAHVVDEHVQAAAEQG